jgi:hypothetical protein
METCRNVKVAGEDVAVLSVVHCSVLEIYFGIALNNGVLLGKEHMLNPCPVLHRYFCA